MDDYSDIKIDEPKKDEWKTMELPRWVFFGIIGGVVLIILIFVLGVQDGNNCISSPFNYGAEKAVETTGGQIFCSCQFSNSEKYGPLYFNDKIITTESFFGVLEQVEGQ